MQLHEPLSIEAIRAAQVRLTGMVVRTPLVRLAVEAVFLSC